MPLRLLLPLIVILAASASHGIERKPISEVDLDALIEETQKSPAGQEDDHTTLVWWITPEFWERSAAGGADAGGELAAMMATLRNYTVLAIVQADLDHQGSFRFYDEAFILKNLKIFRADSKGIRTAIKPTPGEDEDLQDLLALMKPILAGAMGSMGQNLHFVALNDRGADGKRVLDPYSPGSLEIGLATSGGKPLSTRIDFPLNALYVPRKCPNGKDAHVSWKFCPWTGQKLPD